MRSIIIVGAYQVNEGLSSSPTCPLAIIILCLWLGVTSIPHILSIVSWVYHCFGAAICYAAIRSALLSLGQHCKYTRFIIPHEVSHSRRLNSTDFVANKSSMLVNVVGVHCAHIEKDNMPYAYGSRIALPPGKQLCSATASCPSAH